VDVLLDYRAGTHICCYSGGAGMAIHYPELETTETLMRTIAQMSVSQSARLVKA
jgi:hypothetical protein